MPIKRPRVTTILSDIGDRTDMRRALVLGVNGQDGGYLAESLVRGRYSVTGVDRQPVSRYIAPSEAFRYVRLDLRDAHALTELVRDVDPEIAFHVAAVHGPAGFSYEPVWRDMIAVNVLALHTLLDHTRERRPGMKVIYAGSSKIYPPPWSGTIDESTQYRPTCLYSLGKIASLELIGYYRRHHGISASNLILFNHDSVRRSTDHFVPTIARALSAALRDPAATAEVSILDFWIDRSAADELMDIAVAIAECGVDQDFILASGRTWHARAAVEAAFARYGLDYRRHIREERPPSDPGPSFKVDIGRLARAIGRVPVKSVLDIVDSMLLPGAVGPPVPAAPSPSA